MTEARRRAGQLLAAVGRGRRLDLAFAQAAGGLSTQDRRWLQEAAYGTVRLRGRLDHLLDLHLKRGTGSLPPEVLDLFRFGAYQLLYMDSVPAYAAISQTVDQVRAAGGGGLARVANGVLRSLEREGGGEDRFPLLSRDPAAHLATWGSHPSWLVDRWLRRWDPKEVLALVEANNNTPPLFFRPFGTSPTEALPLLEEGGWNARLPESPVPCLRMEDGTNPAKLLDGLPGIIQDPGAGLVTVYAAPPAGTRVTDLCAAPGGKAMALAGEGFPVLAGDLSLPRLASLREHRDRLGGDVFLVACDARVPPVHRADFLLLDVPCSGTGTLRRHPDARWRLTLDTLGTLVELQGEILEGCAPRVPPGGHLVYSTCTLEEEENGRQVARFLEAHPDFEMDTPEAFPEGFLDPSGALRVLPQKWGFDGAYAARLVRKR